MTLDVVILGGGPAGLATAIHCSLRGLKVRVLERGLPGRDKACGEGLMPSAVAELETLAVDLRGLGHCFRGIRYVLGQTEAEGFFGHGCGLGIRRTTLHRVLAGRAEQCGVDLRWRSRATGFSEASSDCDGLFTVHVAGDDEDVQARWVVGADGLLSSVRDWAGLALGPSRRRRFGVRRHYQIEPWTDLVEVHWGARCEAYVTPIGKNEIGVALLWSGRTASFDDLLSEFPELRIRLEAASKLGRDRGAGPFDQRVFRVAKGRLLLVGDAAGYLDPITGEGLGLAFKQARVAADAIVNDDSSLYLHAFSRLGWRTRFVTRRLTGLERLPLLRDFIVVCLARHPRLFSWCLNWMNAGA